MNLVFDVGNSETTVGLFDAGQLAGHWRITSDQARTPDEIGVLLRALLAGQGFDPHAIHGVAIASVVPPVTQPLRQACERWVAHARVVVVDPSSKLPITLQVDEPMSVGADRIVNTLAASQIHRRDAIVVDLGTATTYDCVTRDGVFLGGVIAPGVRTSAETLFKRTSKLPATELVAPDHVIGKRTDTNIRAGVMYGAADAIDGIVGRIKAEWPGSESPIVIATGGLAEVFRDLCRSIDLIDPYLTLTGLNLAFGLLAG
ncbi:MAG: type III pantothenate kinase [Gemmatimonadota bacterium]|nr:type III pantothenate kinase [Gemmatimonadota bacterium]MDE3126938.1 type III pantothenate kinase [Gemmatimonadota bacterium]MDE3215468.1 type III pantothenate kinase [Gemmatimonadota bacterium]